MLEYDRDHTLELSTYIARESMISAVSPPIAYESSEIRLSSKFQCEMVRHDFEKDAIDILRQDGSSFLILDLIDERFCLAKFRNSIVTVSNEFSQCGIAEEQDLEMIKNKLTEGFKKQVKEFCSRIKEIYPEEHVIIHRGRFINTYLCADGTSRYFPLKVIGFNNRMNQMLDELYDWVTENIPGAYVIDIWEKKNRCDSCRSLKIQCIRYVSRTVWYAAQLWIRCLKGKTWLDQTVRKVRDKAARFSNYPHCLGDAYHYECDETHKWGLNPIHYEPDYYREVLRRIMEYMSHFTD